MTERDRRNMEAALTAVYGYLEKDETARDAIAEHARERWNYDDEVLHPASYVLHLIERRFEELRAEEGE